MNDNKLVLFETKLKVSQVRQVVAVLYKEVYDAPALRKILRDIAGGDLVAGQFLEACLDWDARMKKTWWYKEIRSWEIQAGFSEAQVARCRDMLAEFGLIEAKKQPKSAEASALTWHYKVNWARFWSLFCEVVKRAVDDVTELVKQTLKLGTGIPENSERASQENQDAHSDNPGTGTPNESERAPQQMPGDTTVFHLLSSSEKTTGFQPPGGEVPGEKYQKVWGVALDQLKVQLDRANFDTWLRESKLLRVEVGEKTTFVIGVRNGFVKDMLEGRLNRTVRRILCDATCVCADLDGSRVDVRFEIVGAPAPPPEPETPSAAVRKLYEQYIGQVVPDEEPCIQQVSERYPADEIEAAFVNMSLQKSGGRVRDPWGYVQGILRRRAELAGVRVM